MNGASMLLAQLESHQLHVVLVPCRRVCNVGGCYRVAAERNALWYQRFCARHLSSRRRATSKADTRIKRREVIRLLSRLARGLPSRSKYAAELLRLSETVH